LPELDLALELFEFVEDFAADVALEFEAAPAGKGARRIAEHQAVGGRLWDITRLYLAEAERQPKLLPEEKALLDRGRKLAGDGV
jgi:hypothetical protein